MKKRCWDYKVRYNQSVTPSLTSGGTESFTRKTIYFFIRLANIGGVELKNEKDYVLNDSQPLPDAQPDVEPQIEPELEPVIEPQEEKEEEVQ